ncbi:BTB/POZ domain-containing protein 6-B-like [Paramacrobiotus metropolitanus]|uniref:BTB/POZ domain-containing protein 6-B-like n=1 Tax=Paramacrobiotus metropolitanus TaxID=2943436 RepID=UPI00244648C9|nr:BTB/POZ domain-containing protein 6-B-like [Paramacrobiotus metropolitanus]
MAHAMTSVVSFGRRGALGQISQRWKKVLARSELSDVEFAVGRQFGEVKIFRAHKLTLSVSSDVFHTMFYGSLPQGTDTAIDIPDVPPDAFSNMLSFIYAGAVENMRQENAVPTLYCADKYDLPWLAEACTDFILGQLKPDNCLVYLENALRWTPQYDALLEACWDVVDASSGAVFQSEHFSSLERSTLEAILQRNTLSAVENVIYTAVERWAAAACARKNLSPCPKNRRRMLGPALFLVRFPLLTDSQLADGPVKNGLLHPKETCKIFQRKHSTTADDKGPLEFSAESRKYPTFRLRGTHFRFKPQEKIFILDINGDWYATLVICETACAGRLSPIAKQEGGSLQKAMPVQIIRAVDILKRDFPVLAFIDGAFKAATYVSQRSGRHLVNIAGRECSVQFLQLKIASKEVDEWRAAQSAKN